MADHYLCSCGNDSRGGAGGICRQCLGLTPKHETPPVDTEAAEVWRRLGKLARAGILAGECKSGNTYQALRRAGLARDGFAFKGALGLQWWGFTRTPKGERVAAYGASQAEVARG